MRTSKPASPASRAARDEVRAGDGAELGADEDGGALARCGVSDAFPVAAFGADVVRPGQPVREVKVMRSSLCACWTPAVRRFSRIIAGKSCCSP